MRAMTAMGMVARASAGRTRWRLASQKMSQRQIRIELSSTKCDRNSKMPIWGSPHIS